MYRGGSNIEYYTVITNYATNHIMLPILYYASIYYDLKLYRTKYISHYSQHLKFKEIIQNYCQCLDFRLNLKNNKK